VIVIVHFYFQGTCLVKQLNKLLLIQVTNVEAKRNYLNKSPVIFNHVGTTLKAPCYKMYLSYFQSLKFKSIQIQEYPIQIYPNPNVPNPIVSNSNVSNPNVSNSNVPNPLVSYLNVSQSNISKGCLENIIS
jgi:hypothetical protein